MNSHIIDTASGILRLEFLTENQRTQFFTHVKQNRLDGGFQQKKCKVKVEPDSNAGDRLAKQPFYTLLEIFRNILPEEEERHQHSAGAASTELQLTDSPMTKPLTFPTPSFHRQLCLIPSSSWTCHNPLPTSLQHILSFHYKVHLAYQNYSAALSPLPDRHRLLW